jgi:hypothetical protein
MKSTFENELKQIRRRKASKLNQRHSIHKDDFIMGLICFMSAAAFVGFIALCAILILDK